MAQFDFGGGCACGLYKECKCKETSKEQTEEFTYPDNVELKLVKIVAEKHGYILIQKNKIEHLIKTLQQLL